MIATTLAQVNSGDTFTPDNGSTWFEVAAIFTSDGHVFIIGLGDREKASHYWGYTGDEVIVKI